MLSGLSNLRDTEAAQADGAEGQIEATRIKVQETAWQLGWSNGIGTALDDMLREMGLQPRPARRSIWAKIERSFPIDDPRSLSIWLRDNNGPAISRQVVTRVVQEMEVSASDVQFPSEDVDPDAYSDTCYCAAVDRLDESHVMTRIAEYHGYPVETMRILTRRCASAGCENRDRTRVPD
jgi:hypothetical protein